MLLDRMHRTYDACIHTSICGTGRSFNTVQWHYKPGQALTGDLQSLTILTHTHGAHPDIASSPVSPPYLP